MEPKEFLNYEVYRMVGGAPITGDKFGIELELEGRNVALNDVATRGWSRHADGSLRGESIEYTFTGPKTFDESEKLVTSLFKKFKDHGVKFNDSIRTSTHVHLNFSTKTVKSVINFFALFTMLEELLQHYSGEDRKGNLFCISSREAEGIVGVIIDAVRRCSLDRFAGDRFKYAACNLSTLYKFGTIEIRTMRGASSGEQVNAWLSILNDMYKYSVEVMKSPADLITSLSYLGGDEFLSRIFQRDNLKELKKTFPKDKSVYLSLMEGARLLQVFAFAFDDAFTTKVEIPEIKKGVEPLPAVIGEGRWAGNRYSIYRPDGRLWTLVKLGDRGRDMPWNDGDRVDDELAIYWNAERQRFCVNYPDGTVIACRWHKHHILPDEGNFPANERRPVPRAPRRDEEEEMEPDWDGGNMDDAGF